MEKPLLTLQYLFIFIGFVLILGTSYPSYSQIFSRNKETRVSFPTEINVPEVDFQLKSTGIKKFDVNLEKKPINNTKIKIYDFLGNLILEDFISPADGKRKSYDLSQTSSEIFVVEIGNSKYNKTKSIYATPQGKKQKSEESE
ncbi:hypothetical protein [Anditalea andensis]|uniref:Uncharacterized protein n=1 Tax=Anditalea andensis TaxID=1048983 RepID=A0A074KVZ1_9BACT|nr:hypothetical protein [Anditalea andensis]KEO72430.1 hypothetical protein EL17_16945 [Anditalea andensis]